MFATYKRQLNFTVIRKQIIKTSFKKKTKTHEIGKTGKLTTSNAEKCLRRQTLTHC